VTPCLDREAVENRLVTMRKSVGQLGAPGPLDRGRLARDPASGLVVERVLALLADLAFEVNCRVAAAVLDEKPETGAAALGAAERSGVIDARVAAALAPPDGPHHVLVQLYLDAEPERVAGVVSAATAAYAEYVRQVAGWTAGHATFCGLSGTPLMKRPRSARSSRCSRTRCAPRAGAASPTWDAAREGFSRASSDRGSNAENGRRGTAIRPS
jgi:uncharacterized protein YutE (UPF0331/DUF86 family)